MEETSYSGSHDGAEFQLKADFESDILYLNLNGKLTGEEIQKGVEETLELAKQFDGEFNVINDLESLAPPSSEDAEPIREAQEKLVDLGLQTVVRVVSDDTHIVTANAFERRSRKAGYEAELAESVEEAEEKLS